MSTFPSEDYVRATKLIESFSCFFDKISSISMNQDLNDERIFQFKRVLYENINSPGRLFSAVEEFYGNISESSKSSPQNQDDDNLEKVGQKSFSQVFSKPKSSDIQIKKETTQTVSQEFIEDGKQDKTQISTEYLPATSFLVLTKAASHNDMARLFSLASSYAYVRTFSDHFQPVFTALWLSYFEKILKEKNRDSPQDEVTEEDKLLETKENEFLSTFQNLLQNINESDVTKKFYESLLSNPKLSQAGICIFKQKLAKIFAEKDNESGSKLESFEWLKELDNEFENEFFQGLTKIFKISLRFFILTAEKLSEKIFHIKKPDPCTTQYDSNARKEICIFYDKTSNSAYILYPLQKSLEEDNKSQTQQKTKVKPVPNMYLKPPLNSESLKSLKNVGLEFMDNSLTTLDTVSTPVVSLNEVENKDKQTQPRSNTTSRPHQLKKANTLNVFTSNLNDCVTNFTYPESAVVKPMAERMILESPHSAVKEIGYYRMKTFEEEDSLTPKGKEPIPRRPAVHFTQRDSPLVEDKNISNEKTRPTHPEYYRQNSNPLPEMPFQSSGLKPVNENSGKNFSIERSSTQDYSYTKRYLSDSKQRTDYYSENEYQSTHEKIRTLRPTVVSITLKSRFERFNQTINKHEQELYYTADKYLKRDLNQDDSFGKPLGLTSIMEMYQIISTQSKERNLSRPSIGTALKMDGKLVK